MAIIEECLWCARQCVRYSTSATSCNPQISLVLTGWNRYPHLWQMRKLKLKKGKWFASICITDKWLNWDFIPNISLKHISISLYFWHYRAVHRSRNSLCDHSGLRLGVCLGYKFAFLLGLEFQFSWLEPWLPAVRGRTLTETAHPGQTP